VECGDHRLPPGGPGGPGGSLGILCQRCDTRHRERTRHQQLTREALAWAFVTLVVLALLAWAVLRL
jgi:hypothetical protein